MVQMASLELTRKECPSSPSFATSLFTIYINDLLSEFDGDTFVRAYNDDLLISRSARIKYVIVASMQTDVDHELSCSIKVIFTLR